MIEPDTLLDLPKELEGRPKLVGEDDLRLAGAVQ